MELKMAGKGSKWRVTDLKKYWNAPYWKKRVVKGNEKRTENKNM